MSSELRGARNKILLLAGLVVPCWSPTAQARLPPSPIATVPQCRDVTLHAAYLAAESTQQGSGFLLEIRNNREQPIAIPDPVPLSVHWYAVKGQHLFWRASSGSGGSLVDATRESGRLFADEGTVGSPTLAVRTIPGGSGYTWTAFSGSMPALRYRPGCEHCTHGGEREFRAVLAYAYLMTGNTLHCGLRSQPVIMPPLEDLPSNRDFPRQ